MQVFTELTNIEFLSLGKLFAAFIGVKLFIIDDKSSIKNAHLHFKLLLIGSDADNNQFSGPIVPEIGNLKALKRLYLSKFLFRT